MNVAVVEPCSSRQAGVRWYRSRPRLAVGLLLGDLGAAMSRADTSRRP